MTQTPIERLLFWDWDIGLGYRIGIYDGSIVSMDQLGWGEVLGEGCDIVCGG